MVPQLGLFIRCGMTGPLCLRVAVSHVSLLIGANVNQSGGDDILPNAVFFAAHWGEIELIKIFMESIREETSVGPHRSKGHAHTEIIGRAARAGRAGAARDMSLWKLVSTN